jgi:glycosyltransferase involved in cell wall biosynthesis
VNLEQDVDGSERRVVLSANTAWFITNFCPGLIEGLCGAGYTPVVFAPADAAVEDAMRRLGVEHHHVAIDRSGLNPIGDLALFVRYWRLLRRCRPAAYLGFTIKPNIYGATAARWLGIAAVPNVSGLGTAFIRRGPLQWVVTHLYRAAFRKLPVVFFQNAEDSRLFVERRIIRPGQVRLLPGLGIDLDRFEPAPAPQQAGTFLLIGRMLRDKGVMEFVEAARRLRAEMPDARFQLLGPVDEGNLTAITRAELDAWAAEGAIDYLGTTDDVRPFIAAAAVVVLPSYREGMPRALLEGAAMGRLLIASDVPGCRDVVEEGVSGYFCAPRNADSLAAAMRKAARLPLERRLAMGEAARGKVQERFSEEFVVRAYLDVLARLGAARQGS